MIIEADNFRWPRGGYEVREVQQFNEILPGDLIERPLSEPADDPWIISAKPGTGAKTYKPADKRGLFLRFLETPDSLEGTLKFANQWGLLGLPEYAGLDPEGNAVRGEWFAQWSDEIRALKRAWAAWQEVNADSRPETLLGFEFIANMASDRLDGRLKHLFRIAQSGDRLESYFTPNSLIGFIWLEFTRTVTERIEWRHCLHCGSPFPVKDARAMYCGKSCKVMASRKRKEKAQ